MYKSIMLLKFMLILIIYAENLKRIEIHKPNLISENKADSIITVLQQKNVIPLLTSKLNSSSRAIMLSDDDLVWRLISDENDKYVELKSNLSKVKLLKDSYVVKSVINQRAPSPINITRDESGKYFSEKPLLNIEECMKKTDSIVDGLYDVNKFDSEIMKKAELGFLGDYPRKEYTIVYTAKKDGIYHDGRVVYITIDNATGFIINYYFIHEYPKTNKLYSPKLSETDVKNNFEKHTGISSRNVNYVALATNEAGLWFWVVKYIVNDEELETRISDENGKIPEYFSK